GALLNRMNFAVSLVGDGGRGMNVPGPGRGGQQPPPLRPNALGPGRGGRAGGPPAFAARGPLQVDVNSLAPDITEATRDRLVSMMLGGRASDGTTKTLARAEMPTQLVALTLGSPEFQKR